MMSWLLSRESNQHLMSGMRAPLRSPLLLLQPPRGLSPQIRNRLAALGTAGPDHAAIPACFFISVNEISSNSLSKLSTSSLLAWNRCFPIVFIDCDSAM
jgi:hypothetical protein